MKGNDWVNRAVEGIRFAPDREAVRKELCAHLEDRREALEARGLTAEEAESAAAQAMGDPAEVAEALAKIHSPWWGYLWRVSQWTLALVLFFSFCALFAAASGLLEELRSGWHHPGPPVQAGERYVFDGAGLVLEGEPGAEVTVLEIWQPEGSVRLGNYRFSAPWVWLERRVYTTMDGEVRDYRQLTVELRAGTWRFWEPCGRPSELFPYRPATDSGGGLRNGWRIGAGGYFCRFSGQGFLSSWYWVEIILEDTEEVPDWVEIPLGYGGDSIRVDIKNGRVS